MASITEAIRTWALAPVMGAISEMRSTIMANVSAVLNEVRDGINGPLRTKVEALLASEAAARLEAQVARAELAGVVAEDVEESTAAAEVRDAFNGVAELFEPADVPAEPVDPIEPAPVDPAEVPSNPAAPAAGSDI